MLCRSSIMDMITKELQPLKEYISYSAYSLYHKNKSDYIKRYFYGEKLAWSDTPEIIFGRQIAERLEHNDPAYAWIPHYSVTEKHIRIGMPKCTSKYIKQIDGRIDSYCPDTFAFLDHKTGHTRADGTCPWSPVITAKHEQLVWYSLLIKATEGKVNNKCSIVWLETEWKENTRKIGNTTLSLNKYLQLTGRCERFYRTVTQKERNELLKKIKETVSEIEKEYEKIRTETL